MGILENIQKDEEFYWQMKPAFSIVFLCSAIRNTLAMDRGGLKDLKCGISSYIKANIKSTYKFSGALGLMLFLCVRVITSSGKRYFEL